MKKALSIILLVTLCIAFFSCNNGKPYAVKTEKYAKDILGNPDYLAISYGGYRQNTRNIQPTIENLKEDIKILSAMNVKILRTYNVHLAQASNLLKAIKQLKEEDKDFEMYVMLGAWIDCKDAWTANPNHDEESERNTDEINTAVKLANQYPDIVKIIAVGNEAMVHWASNYFVKPKVILKWVNHLQKLKKEGNLPKDLWITSSDNFASWGGDTNEYHCKDLEDLIKAVDYLSVHTYPFHDTYYNPGFWNSENQDNQTDLQKVDASMIRAKNHAVSQYQGVLNYINSIGVTKPIHIGETGWASVSDGFYGNKGSKAADEYKQAQFYNHMREWTKKENMSCFYFEAFDENWKDSIISNGSENHFGLFTIDGKAKYALWQLVDNGIFKGLTRNGKPIVKTFDGSKDELLKTVLVPSLKKRKIR